MSALLALREGAAALLDAEGEAALAALVRGGRVELAGPGETWAMGAREVTAHRVALGLGAEALVALGRDAGRRDKVRAAFAQAMRGAATELLELHLELILPGLDRAWGRAYREAPARTLPAEPADPEAVRAGAARLLACAGCAAAAEMLGRARLDGAAMTGADVPWTRFVIQLAAADRAHTWAHPEVEEQLRRAVHDAASRAGEQVTVEVGAASSG